MSILFLSFIFVLVISLALFFSFFCMFSRFSSVKAIARDIISSIVSSYVAKALLFFLFSFLVMSNVLGNIPLSCIPTMFYSFTFSVSLAFWLPLMFCVSISQMKEFLAHMLPYGSPVGLMLFLPLVEIFSQLIRPLTLMIRLRTNLSAGHIMMYMFSYFTLLSSVLAPFIYSVLAILFVLELCISVLQAYIFVSLLSLYVNETV